MVLAALVLAALVGFGSDGDPADGPVEDSLSTAVVALVIIGQSAGLDFDAVVNHLNAELAEHNRRVVVVSEGTEPSSGIRVRLVDQEEVILSVAGAAGTGAPLSRVVSLADTPSAARELVVATAIQDIILGSPPREPARNLPPQAPTGAGSRIEALDADAAVLTSGEQRADVAFVPLLASTLIGGALTSALYPVTAGFVVVGVLAALGAGMGLVSPQTSAAVTVFGIGLGLTLAAGGPLAQGLVMAAFWDQVSRTSARWWVAIASSYLSAIILAAGVGACGAIAFAAALLIVPTFIGTILLLGLPLYIYLPIAFGLYFAGPAVVLTTATVIQPVFPTAAIALTAHGSEGTALLRGWSLTPAIGDLSDRSALSASRPMRF